MGERSDLWKDSVDKKFVANLALRINQVYQTFDRTEYVRTVMADRFLKRELKDRLNTIARHLKDFLPPNYNQATAILIKAAPLVGEFSNWALTSYVEQFGQDKFDRSIKVLKELTRYGTSEFGIRPFVNQYPEEMIKIFLGWSTDRNEHVRRLAAEGSRPRGVWVAHIPEYKKDPRGVLKILEGLKADRSLYVRKAVANNLNDISKDRPELVIKTARRWLKSKDPLTHWIVKHGCRTLIKKGNPEILKAFGFEASDKIRLVSLKLSRKQIKIGESIKLEFMIESNSRTDHSLLIDYQVSYARSSGRTSSKIFKFTKRTIKPGEKIKLATEHKFANISTRKHHPGRHSISLFINGVQSPPATFKLIA